LRLKVGHLGRLSAEIAISCVWKKILFHFIVNILLNLNALISFESSVLAIEKCAANALCFVDGEV